MDGIILLLTISFFNHSEEFEFAVRLFNDSLYTLARQEFINFINKHKESELVPKAQYLSAECLYRQKKYKEAIEEFRVIANIYPKFFIDANKRIGLAYYSLGIYDSSIAAFERIKEKEPDEANYWIGECYFKLNEYEKAISYYKEVKKGEYKEYAFYSIGFANMKLKRYNEAISYLSLITEEKIMEQSELLIAKCFYEKGDYKEAINRLKNIKGKYEDEALFLLGESYYKLNKFDEAIKYYNKCNSPLAIAGIGRSYYALKEYDKAIEAYKNLVNYPEHKEEAIEWIGRIYYEKKNYSEAINWFNKINTYNAKVMIANSYFNQKQYNTALNIYDSLYSNTKNDELLYNIALTLCKIGKYDEAKQKLNLYKKENPRVFLLFGEIYYKEGNYSTALNYYEKASKDSTTEKDGWFGMKDCYVKLGQNDEAYKIAKYLVGKYPSQETYRTFAEVAYITRHYDEAAEFYSLSNAPDALFSSAKIYYEAGNYDKAIERFNNFLEKFPLHPLASQGKYLIGLAYAKKGEYKKSTEIMKELISFYPGTELSYDAKCVIGDNYFNYGEFSEAESSYYSALDELKEYSEKALTPIFGILDCRLAKDGLNSAVDLAQKFIKRTEGSLVADKIRIKIGDMCFNEGNYDLAIKFYKEVKADELKSLVYYSIGNCYYKMKKKDEMVEMLNKSAELGDEYSMKSLYKLGEMEFNEKNYAKAKEYFEKIIKNYKEDEETKIYLALCYLKENNINDGKKLLKELLRSEKIEVKAKAMIELGKLFLSQDSLEQAEHYFSLVLESGVSEVAPEARYYLGKTYFKKEKYEEAIRTFLQVKYLYPENEFITPALYEAGECSEKIGKIDEARKFYELVVKRGDIKEYVDNAKKKLK